MRLTLHRAPRPIAFALIVLAAAGCDDATTLDPVGRPLEAVAFAGGIPIGTFQPADLLDSLAIIRERGGRVMLAIGGGPNQYKDADGHFRFVR